MASKPTKHWALPKGKTIWLLFDLNNGDAGSRRYVWWFNTRGMAMAHRRHQHKMEFGAKLSMPVRATL